jgi:pimeloyl-ACP methyl ester carboxylesterase
MTTKKYIQFVIVLSWIMLLVGMFSCNEGQGSREIQSDMMGRFDSLIVAQEKGPSIEAFYEKKVIHVQIPTKDSLYVFGDIYEMYDSTLKLLFCHQAGNSKGEYLYHAILFSQMGYNGMAIDLRSGGTVNNIPNQTALMAIQKGVPNEYKDAYLDIIAAIDFIYECNGGVPIVLVGSSYSASLCLLIAKNNSKVRAVIAFSPGEYLEDIHVSDELEGMDKPVFVTSSKMEIPQTVKLLSRVDSSLITHYKPKVEGVHGSAVLNKLTYGYKDYWEAVFNFLHWLEKPKVEEELVDVLDENE